MKKHTIFVVDDDKTNLQIVRDMLGNDYDLLLGHAQNERAMKAIDDFIDSKLKSTYIVLDPIFSDCEFNRSAWSQKFRVKE
jgi:hypothetical protein